MDYKLAYPGRFVEGPDLKGQDVTVTIAAVKVEEMDGKTKLILRFEGAKKELVVNRTNAEAFRLMFGRETDGWISKRVTLFPITIKDPFSSDENATVVAVRVRGSPDIAAPLSDVVRLGKSNKRISVVPTGQAATAAPSPPAAPAPVHAPPPQPQANAAPVVVDVFAGETEDAAMRRTTTRDPFAGNGLDSGHGLNGSGL